MKNIWFLSGLGADERAFQNLDCSGWNPHFVAWIPPLEKETIRDYSKRLLAQITEANPILVGYSFGGMVAVEMAQLIPARKVIIIASAKTRDELPPHFRAVSHLPVYRLVPPGWIIKPKEIYYWLFDVHRQEEKKLLSEIIQDTDPAFLSWAMKAITGWQNTRVPNHLVHIHGTADRILPFRYVRPDVVIQNGGHFMLVNRAAEISNLLHNLIDEATYSPDAATT
jgi:pimeloyl-ACP methyl ester carboxylesterase